MTSSKNYNINEDKHGVQEKYIEAIKESSQKQINAVDREIDDLNTDIANRQDEITTLEIRGADLAASIKDGDKVERKNDKYQSLDSDINQKLIRLTREIKFYEENDNCPTCHQDISEDFRSHEMGKKEEKIVDVSAGAVQLRAELERMDARLIEISLVNEDISECNTLISGHNHYITSNNRQLSRLNNTIIELKSQKGDLREAKGKLSGFKKALKELIKRKEELINEKETFLQAATLLKDGGVKAQIIKQYVPVMNKLISKYLAMFEFFVGFELDENFNEVLTSRHRDEFTYASFSEGEKMRIDLALLLTWRSIAKMKNSTNTNLLILDEVFDASLDTSGCDEFMKLIGDFGEDANVFIISHKGDALVDKFASTIRFEKVKNFSRIAE